MHEASDKRSRTQLVLNFLRQIIDRNPTSPPGDPYSYVTVPLRRGPSSRGGSAVADIDGDSFDTFPPRRS
jgi:hypothetical protein